MERLEVLDLFSGIGGFSLGLERTGGFETVAFCEADPFRWKVLRARWPGVPIYNDVRTANFRKFTPSVITAGFPCTQTSVAAAIHGKRKGLGGADSGLWFECKRHIDAIKSNWVLVENPSGVKKWESEIQGWLESIGYTVSRLEFKATDFGLPHIRRRYVYVANTYKKRLEISGSPGSSKIDWYKRLAVAGGSWISDTPRVVGSYNGLPHRVDRVKALGDTISPCYAQVIGEMILKVEIEKNETQEK